MKKKYDIIIVGGGHSGIEASLSSHNLGAKVLLITMNINNIGKMSCNPSIGGIGKGQLVKEIDALGGYMGILADLSTIQFRMLNKSKGPAMWSPRAQIDRNLYIKNVYKFIKKINILEDIVIKLIIKKNKILGVKTKKKKTIKCKSVILTNGTFLNGKIFIGNKYYKGGRINEKSSLGLTNQLKKYGLLSNKMKTGTSPRICKKSINFNKIKIQKGDKNPEKFSYRESKIIKLQKNCYITYTNKKTHKIIKDNYNKSPIFKKKLNNNGPRYCPSIEEKVLKFKEKDKHQIFIEPDGFKSNIMYINGFSTCLPKKKQYKAIKTIKGLENCKILEYGYAVEYSYFNPIQLKITLETKKIKNLFLAGQINGTTGYEEAASQGLIAGINSYLKINNKKPFILKRNESYIGVLIDDLITKGTNEPYRMFTSRVEYRILLSQDNADIRLSKKGYKLGLIKKKYIKNIKKKKKKINLIIKYFNKKKIFYKKKKIIIKNLILRSEININNILNYIKNIKIIKNNLKFFKKYKIIIYNYIKYEYYIKKEKKNVKMMNKLENFKIPKNFNYLKIKSLSNEAKEKLNYLRPLSIGQASRISGISPSDINVLIIYIR
ncbi:MAG: tRNA uridine-5-carboxymethylaminomethyl(34) synthesis enzyme MnmG [Candidatus Shikimatogenerans bostrichidophilus]|nr:MAG: tRNA uridine-5-carboxymethylaminomethyl(34) synthesis enzyme MnmG [Candidatus Shikimatogenerans bostrichidophilus]